MVVQENQIGIETHKDYATRSELLPIENDEKKLDKKKTLFEQVIQQIRKNPTNVFKKVDAASDSALANQSQDSQNRGSDILNHYNYYMERS